VELRQPIAEHFQPIRHPNIGRHSGIRMPAPDREIRRGNGNTAITGDILPVTNHFSVSSLEVALECPGGI
jgi:hypothetical protein